MVIPFVAAALLVSVVRVHKPPGQHLLEAPAAQCGGGAHLHPAVGRKVLHEETQRVAQRRGQVVGEQHAVGRAGVAHRAQPVGVGVRTPQRPGEVVGNDESRLGQDHSSAPSRHA